MEILVALSYDEYDEIRNYCQEKLVRFIVVYLVRFIDVKVSLYVGCNRLCYLNTLTSNQVLVNNFMTSFLVLLVNDQTEFSLFRGNIDDGFIGRKYHV